MADASCSGSTPLKSLSEHQSRDTSRHRSGQPRPSFTSTSAFRSQHSTPGSFRSQHDFSSFMKNEELAGLASLGDAHAQASQGLAFPLLPQGGLPHDRAQMPPAAPSELQWAKEYSLSPSGMTTAHGSGSQHVGSQIFGAGLPSFSSMQQGLVQMPVPAQQGNPVHETDFRRDLETGTNLALDDVDHVLKQIAEELERTSSVDPIAQSAMASTLPEISQTLAKNGGRPSEVSEIAKKILESVHHEDDVKWRQSTFLALMRDFRDGKKVINDDKIQDSPGE